jgi:lysosomal alpha-mannosidase
LTVHLVPHSHDDMGWVKTIDEYYSGSKIGKDHSSVRNTLDSVIHEMIKNENRKFTVVEMGFFTTWYNSQS